MNPDFVDLLRALLVAEVRFLIVGAYAVGVHGRPRATKDLDIWVEPTSENAPKIFAALLDFGAPLDGVSPEDFSTPGVVLQIGVEPIRADILTEVSGLRFDEAWAERIEATFAESLRCPVIGLEGLIRNKRASARPQDLADVDALERIKRRGP
jgi:hypothetical protein